MRSAYSTDLSDVEWACLEPYLPAQTGTGRPRVHSLREILDAVFYIVRSGCAWRLLPHDFPSWKTVHHYFRMWRIDGTWERLNAALKDNGYDCAPIIEPMLADAAFVRRGECLDEAIQAAEGGEITPESAQHALSLIEELERMLTELIPFMSEEELAEHKKRGRIGLTRSDLAAGFGPIPLKFRPDSSLRFIAFGMT